MSFGQIVRQAQDEDCTAILHLWRQMMEFHAARDPFFTISAQGPDTFLKWIRAAIGKEGMHVAVAVVGGAVAGYSLSAVSRYPPVFTRECCCEIYDVSVSERHRRKGIGSALFRDIREWATREGITRIEARVAVANEVSTKFWRTLGLKPYMESMYIEL